MSFRCRAARGSAAVSEPQPPDPGWPRYSTSPFPAYRFVPGQTPHPRRHPLGHSHGQPEPRPAPFCPDDWPRSADYLLGIDLYNFAYWWECHEIFEGLWHAAGHDTAQGRCFQALIQLAAANLKRFLSRETAAQKLYQNGMARLQSLPCAYMGIDVTGLIGEVHARLVSPHLQPPLIGLGMEQNSDR